MVEQKTAFIIHGTEGYPEENWFPWLKRKLELLEYTVFVPQFPTPKNQDPEHWFEVFENYEKYLNKDTIIVAHSGGCAFLLRLLEKTNIKIKLAVFVAPPIGILPIKYIDADKPFIDHPFDWNKIKNNSNNFLVFHSEDDPFICIGNGELVAKELGVDLIRLKNAGHFNAKSGYLKFDLLLEKIKFIIQRKAINAIIIQNKKLLITKKKETWILPGGKPLENEQDLDCLKREVSEELSGTKIKNIKSYSNFQGITPHKGDMIETHAYFCEIDGQLNKHSAEILDAKFVSDFNNYNLSDTTKKIVEKLKKDKYL